MSGRLGAAVVSAIALSLAAPLAAPQTPAGKPAASPRAGLVHAVAPPGWTSPKTSWGAPDLQGIWSNGTITTLERPASYGDRLVMTPEEITAAEGARPAEQGAAVMRINGEARTSFVVEPKNGKLPGLTPEASKARVARMAAIPRGPDFGRGDNPESLTLAERCLKDFGSSSGPPMMPLGYNNTYQIVQTPTSVMILVEMVHDVRIVELTKDRKRPPVIRQWMGDAIGWYEGDTLVVETRNFRPGQGFRSADNTPIVERWRRVNDQQILYTFEIDDPKMFTATLKAEEAWNAAPGPIFEYACAEGNYAFASILAGERQADAQFAAANSVKGKKR